MDADTIAAAIAIAFAAALCQSVTGFGFALVMTPLLAVAWDVKAAVATTQLVSLLGNVLVLQQIREHVSYRRLPGLYAGFLLGIVPGLIFLERVHGDALQVVVGVFVVAATGVLYFQPSVDPGYDSFGLRVAAGAVSGFTGASTGMGGPPVILYMLGREAMDSFRATLLAYFFPSSVLTLAAFIIAGRITGQVLTVGAFAAPAIVAGVYAGAWLRGRINAEVFRRVVVAVLVLTSVVVVISAVLR